MSTSRLFILVIRFSDDSPRCSIWPASPAWGGCSRTTYKGESLSLEPFLRAISKANDPKVVRAVHDGALISYCFASPRASSAGLRILLAEDSYSDGHDVADDDAGRLVERRC
ncbi:hypothetical protein AB1Y20_014283 [Prymnesium parvum]|uniref:Uncharacterized protein n=1 Tax=Prymnesium parvum TaxID=97485 RepID=A0AB34IGB7_PRYPA